MSSICGGQVVVLLTFPVVEILMMEFLRFSGISVVPRRDPVQPPRVYSGFESGSTGFRMRSKRVSDAQGSHIVPKSPNSIRVVGIII